MAEKLTPQQEQAVNDRGGKLLVSAAAGSGKTKVLVDRILSYLKDPVNPANIDDFLIITYTKAAAAELRGKIATKLNKEIAADPGNRHLQRQLQRLYLAKISTVHSYCADVLREHAYHLDIPVDFRVMEENESKEMQFQIIDKLLEEAYRNINEDPDFAAFVDTQGFGRNDRQLSELVWKLYAQNARCHMDPDAWLESCLAAVELTDQDELSQTPWAKYLIEDLHQYLSLQIKALNRCIDEATRSGGLEKQTALLQDTIAQLDALCKSETIDQIRLNSNIVYGTLSFPRKNIDADLAERIKAVRNACKDGVQAKLSRFVDSSEQIAKDMAATAAAARGLITFTRRFVAEYDNQKRRKRVFDFGDLEHKMLDLLLGKGRYGATATAREIGERFREVMVDEYQDSNEVQDAIFSAITEKKQNCFMVGDVKQSIYRFRQADPDIFLKKYAEYVPADKAKAGEGRKVMLSSNFRSSGGVIDAVNDVFSLCMSEKVGGIYYGADERLYEGIPHVPLNEPEVELYGVSVNHSNYVEEAAFVAHRVQELLDGTHMVRDGDNLRPICPDDIAILLRSPGSTGGHYMDALGRVGIRCCIGQGTNLFDAEEVQVLRAILQIVDNPQQDIPLLAVLTSKVFRFTADDLAVLRSSRREGSIYEALRKDNSDKATQFISSFSSLRRKARTSSLMGLIKHVIAITKLDSIFASMSDGENRLENLLSFYKLATDFDICGGKSLNAFLSHLEAMEKAGLGGAPDQSSAGAVTIMSIHKSKGLEFPVVILPALSKRFNSDDSRDQMVCDKDLGIGLSCVDIDNRVRYPSALKNAIAAKTLADGLSEEMRIMYVALTRPRDRLIMTYASKKLAEDLAQTALRMTYTPELLISEAKCMGDWILYSAMKRIEAGAFFAISSSPGDAHAGKSPWLIKVVEPEDPEAVNNGETTAAPVTVSDETIERMVRSLEHTYSYLAATKVPSKQTATQIKGRDKDTEIVEKTDKETYYVKSFRKPTFIESTVSATKRGTAMHTAMQHICYSACKDVSSVEQELERMRSAGLISEDERKLVDPAKIAGFFNTPLGMQIMAGREVLREFKFSILEDAERFCDGVAGEKVLLQGVVDCALVEDDGITVVDFKTDKVSSGNINDAIMRYKPQVFAYANALERIYQKPIKSIVLYFFDTETAVTM